MINHDVLLDNQTKPPTSPITSKFQQYPPPPPIWWLFRLKSATGYDVTKQVITYVNCIVSGRNYDLLASIIAQLLTSRPFSDLCWRVSISFKSLQF